MKTAKNAVVRTPKEFDAHTPPIESALDSANPRPILHKTSIEEHEFSRLVMQPDAQVFPHTPFSRSDIVIWLYMIYSNIASYIKDTLNKVTQPEGVDINEYVIEQYVRFRDTLDRSTQLAVSDYINRYAGAAAIERFYSQVYEEYDQLGTQLAPRVKAFVATLFD